jgi:hypothetical protein
MIIDVVLVIIDLFLWGVSTPPFISMDEITIKVTEWVTI